MINIKTTIGFVARFGKADYCYIHDQTNRTPTHLIVDYKNQNMKYLNSPYADDLAISILIRLKVKW